MPTALPVAADDPAENAAPMPAPRLAAAALLAAAAASSALAQTALPAINVTAKGYATATDDTPVAVEILAADAAKPAAPAGELLRGGPGLSVRSDGAWGQDPVIRGLGRESIVVLVDGVRVNSAQPQGAIASMIDAGLLDRIEVVKGPTSVLHGSGALGGAVNLLTPQPRFSDQPRTGGRFSLGGSSADRAGSAALLLEHSGPERAFVVGAAMRDAGDYDSPEGRTARTGFRSDSLLARYRQRLGRDASLWFNVQRHADHDVWYPGSARTGGQPGGAGIPPPLGTVTLRSPEQRRELYEVGVDTALGAGRLEASVQRQEVFRQVRAWSDKLGRDYVRNDVTFVTNGGQVRYLLPAGRRHLLTLGLQAWRTTGDPARYIDGNAPAFDNNARSDPFDRGVLRSTGLYLQDEVDLGRLKLLAGVRADRVEGDARSQGAQARTEGLHRADDTLSWSAGAVWELTPALRPYANLSRAWRAADLRERFEDAARGDGYYHVGNPALRPERATGVELGLRGRAATLDWRVAAFHTRIDDYIAGRVTGAVAPGTGLPVKLMENVDRAVLRGLEGSAAMSVGAIVVDAAFTWLRGDNRQDDEPLYRIAPPELRIGVGQPAQRGLHWRAQWRAVAGQDRVATRLSNGTEDRTPGFATVDLAAGWKFGPLWSLRDAAVLVRLANLFDRSYHEHLQEGLSGRELLAPGRSLSVAFRGSF